MTLSEIFEQKQLIEFDGPCKIHESTFRSYHILNKVIQMIDRGDSKESIFDVIEFLDPNRITEAFIKPFN